MQNSLPFGKIGEISRINTTTTEVSDHKGRHYKIFMLKRHRREIFTGYLLLSDIVAIILSYLLAYWIRFYCGIVPVNKGIPFLGGYTKLLLPVTLVSLFVLHSIGLYQTSKRRTSIDEFWTITKAITIVTIMITAATFFYREFSYSRLVIAYAWGLGIVLIFFFRQVMKKVEEYLDLRVKRVVIVGLSGVAKKIWKQANSHHGSEWEITGFIPANNDNPGKDNLQVLGNLSQLSQIIKDKEIDEVILTTSLPHKEILDI